jgi:hypothetical protein
VGPSATPGPAWNVPPGTYPPAPDAYPPDAPEPHPPVGGYPPSRAYPRPGRAPRRGSRHRPDQQGWDMPPEDASDPQWR